MQHYETTDPVLKGYTINIVNDFLVKEIKSKYNKHLPYWKRHCKYEPKLIPIKTINQNTSFHSFLLSGGGHEFVC